MVKLVKIDSAFLFNVQLSLPKNPCAFSTRGWGLVSLKGVVTLLVGGDNVSIKSLDNWLDFVLTEQDTFVQIDEVDGVKFSGGSGSSTL